MRWRRCLRKFGFNLGLNFFIFLLLWLMSFTNSPMAAVEGVEHLGPAKDLVDNSYYSAKILMPPASNGTMFYVICNGKLYKTDDGGKTLCEFLLFLLLSH